MTPNPSIERVPATTIRQAFNASQHPQNIANGEYEEQFLRNDHLKNPAEREEPTCTRSQAIRYFDADGRWIVEVHRYLRPDGTLGGSGREDPKRLRLCNRTFIFHRGRA